MGFYSHIESLLKHEGGYVNDPDDPGGETNMGISKRAYPDLDIKSLTKADVTQIYYEDYWKRSKADKLPETLQGIYFDMVVNMGLKRAVIVLQQAINGKGDGISVDGKIGPQTILHASLSDLEAERLRSYRVKYYASLVQRKPKLEKYWFGWYRRALQV